MPEREKKYVLRDLHEIMEELIQKLGSQTKLGEQLGIYQSKVSQMKNAGKGSDWPEHFRISARLIELCYEHGVKPKKPAPSQKVVLAAGKKKAAGRF